MIDPTHSLRFTWRDLAHKIANGQQITIIELGNICDEATWTPLNDRRYELVASKIAKSISPSELAELETLQKLSAVRSRLLAPLPVQELEQTIIEQFDALLASQAAEIERLKARIAEYEGQRDADGYLQQENL